MLTVDTGNKVSRVWRASPPSADRSHSILLWTGHTAFYCAITDRQIEGVLQVCNHPALSYQPMYVMEGGDLVRQCGKFAVLDRMLTKLHATGHRVLLFSTMTRLLDLLEQYLRWRTVGPERRHMGFLRIDGSTSLDDRQARPPLSPCLMAAGVSTRKRS